ncbi:hypothetical protein HZH66_004952 [Vespula vulgaris]|uniref:Uncharacterized protein n=1 Tax=Vespula vulgaris TaxID=7454 RepID=A0A834KA13_VESVU|nr:hypothetical protein HZH66_004952 [Vespula vulgaris]
MNEETDEKRCRKRWMKEDWLKEERRSRGFWGESWVANSMNGSDIVKEMGYRDFLRRKYFSFKKAKGNEGDILNDIDEQGKTEGVSKKEKEKGLDRHGPSSSSSFVEPFELDVRV